MQLFVGELGAGSEHLDMESLHAVAGARLDHRAPVWALVSGPQPTEHLGVSWLFDAAAFLK